MTAAARCAAQDGVRLRVGGKDGNITVVKIAHFETSELSEPEALLTTQAVKAGVYLDGPKMSVRRTEQIHCTRHAWKAFHTCLLLTMLRYWCATRLFSYVQENRTSHLKL